MSSTSCALPAGLFLLTLLTDWLVVRVAYSHKRILIKFVGTHADYDKVDARTV